jgi:ABC-type transport system involved in multi-copper enzyme maturation permease subunit
MSTMTEETPSTRDDLLGSTPSRETTETPGWVRIAGLVGMVAFAAGLVGHIYNANLDYRLAKDVIDTAEKPWRFGFVTLFQLVGLIGLLIQATKERDRQYRLFTGIFGIAFFTLGIIFLTNMLAGEGVKNWMLASGSAADVAYSRGRYAGLGASIVMALVLLLAWIAPFVRSLSETHVSFVGLFRQWLTHLGESRISAMTLSGALVLAVMVGLAYFAKEPLIAYGEKVLQYSPENAVPYGLGSFAVGFLLLGLPFMLIFSKTEDDTGWAGVPASLLVTTGTLLAFFGLIGFFVDLLGVPDYTFPYGVGLAILGLFFLGLYAPQHRGGFETRYHVARWMGYAGLIVLVIAALRSFLPWLFDITWLHDTFESLEGINLPSYLVPNGFMYMVLGAAYFLLGRMLSSQSAFMVMTRKELAAFLTSPIGYIVLGGVVVLAWIVFYFWVVRYLLTSTLRGSGFPEPVVAPYFFDWFISLFVMIAVPMLTMRLLSEESRSGTMEVLLTAPVSEWAIVVSKFLAAWIFVVLVFLVWLIFPTLLRIAGQESFDFRPMLSSIVGWSLVSFGFVAMGVFFSSVSRNQIVPMLLTFAGILMLFMLHFLESFMANDPKTDPNSPLLETIRYFSFVQHMFSFSSGKVYLKHVLFHLSFGLFWLFLTIRVLESRKWR